MFSGIITDVGRVRRLHRAPGEAGGLEATIATAYDSAAIPLGASIACSGPCLTVVAVEPGAFSVQASAETLRSEEHTSELQSHSDLVCRLLLEKKKKQ